MTEQTLWDPPKVEIDGEEYELRRLGLPDLQRVPSIIREAIDKGMSTEVIDQVAAGADDEITNKVGINVLLETLPFVTEELTKWLLDIVEGFEVEDPTDPDELPLPVIMDIFNALGEHEDFEKFFTRLGKSIDIFQKILDLSLGSSTGSSQATDGQTNES